MAYSVGSVAMYDLFANLPTLGTTGEIYFCSDTNLFYQWTAGAYVSISTSAYGTPRVISSVGGSATPTINIGTTDLYEVTALAQAITGVTITGTPVDGQQLKIRLTDNGVAKAVALGTSFVASGLAPGATLLTTTIAGKTHMNVFVYDSTKAKFYATYVDTAGY